MLRFPKKIKTAMIVTAAIQIAEEEGLMYVTPASAAMRCMVPTSNQTVRTYFTKMELYSAILTDDRCSEKVKRQGKDMGLL